MAITQPANVDKLSCLHLLESPLETTPSSYPSIKRTLLLEGLDDVPVAATQLLPGHGDTHCCPKPHGTFCVVGQIVPKPTCNLFGEDIQNC